MYDCFGLQSFTSTIQSGEAPGGDFVEEDVERWLSELDDVHSGGFQLAGFLVQDGRELPVELLAAAVVRILQGINHGHRARKGTLDLAVGTGEQELRVLNKDWFFTFNGTDHGRNAGVIAVADAYGLALFEVEIAQVLNERDDKVVKGLLQHCCTYGDLFAPGQRRIFQLPMR